MISDLPPGHWLVDVRLLVPVLLLLGACSSSSPWLSIFPLPQSYRVDESEYEDCCRRTRQVFIDLELELEVDRVTPDAAEFVAAVHAGRVRVVYGRSWPSSRFDMEVQCDHPDARYDAARLLAAQVGEQCARELISGLW